MVPSSEVYYFVEEARLLLEETSIERFFAVGSVQRGFLRCGAVGD